MTRNVQVGQPPIELPQDVVDHIRRVFSQVNRESAATLTRVPNIHEPTLDQSLIVDLARKPSRIMRQSGSVVSFTTYYLGGTRQFRRWEIADIGVVVNISIGGQRALTKIALLQSKRLYAGEDKAAANSDVKNFMFGFGGLYQAAGNPVARQRFTFTAASRYRELDLKAQQVKMIQEYPGEHGIPVEYMLYNPLQIPISADLPSTSAVNLGDVENKVGIRIVAAPDMHALASMAVRRPRYSDVATIPGDSSHAPFNAGWRLEDFIVDLVLACHAGYATTSMDETLYNVFNARNFPLSAAFGVNIDLDNDSDRVK